MMPKSDDICIMSSHSVFNGARVV